MADNFTNADFDCYAERFRRWVERNYAGLTAEPLRRPESKGK